MACPCWGSRMGVASPLYHLLIYKSTITVKLCLPALAANKKLHFVGNAVFNFPFHLAGSAGVFRLVTAHNSSWYLRSRNRPIGNVAIAF